MLRLLFSGDLLFYASDYRIGFGDVAIFKSSDSTKTGPLLVAHRCLGLGRKTIIASGDNNRSFERVSKSDCIGKVIMVIGQKGDVYDFQMKTWRKGRCALWCLVVQLAIGATRRPRRHFVGLRRRFLRVLFKHRNKLQEAYLSACRIEVKATA